MSESTVSALVPIRKNQRSIVKSKVIELYRDKKQPYQILSSCPGNLCFTLELQHYIASSLDIPLSEVSGVITFYSSSLPSQEENTQSGFVCTACYVRAGKIIERLSEILA